MIDRARFVIVVTVQMTENHDNRARRPIHRTGFLSLPLICLVLAGGDLRPGVSGSFAAPGPEYGFSVDGTDSRSADNLSQGFRVRVEGNRLHL